jgi:hypothetical protein
MLVAFRLSILEVFFFQDISSLAILIEFIQNICHRFHTLLFSHEDIYFIIFQFHRSDG